ncbi:hypothetical protein Q3G72_035304 [Acer saccharum]|nr:hypothetical protein Q3G72_035304 [Acer saccharum]
MLQAVANNVVSRCVLGRKAEEENGPGKFGELSRRAMVLMTAFCFGDFFPCLRWLDIVTGHIGRINTTFKAFDALLDQVIEEHKISKSEKKDFVHILLQLQKDGMLEIDFTQNDMKAILQDMFVGGTDTTSTTLEWAMAELVNHPNIMKNAQEEVRTEYTLANILYWFDWKLPGGAIDHEKLDMTEVYGLTVPKKFPLSLVPTLYSPSNL